MGALLGFGAGGAGASNPNVCLAVGLIFMPFISALGYEFSRARCWAHAGPSERGPIGHDAFFVIAGSG
jgi:hypothetical protein